MTINISTISFYYNVFKKNKKHYLIPFTFEKKEDIKAN